MSVKKNVVQTDSKPSAAYNTYYMHVASRYRFLKWILLLGFTLYLVFTLLVFRGSISQENLLYLLRDFNVSAVSDGGFSSVIYEEKQNMTFAPFKGELVVAGTADISFYNGSGARTLQGETPCQRPVIETSDKYLLLYDEGGTSYSLYTTIARVKSAVTTSAIQCADVSDSGVYAIATRSQEAKYAITLYSSSFSETARYYRDSYITDIALRNDGEQLAMIGVVSENSALRGVLTLCKVGTEEMRDISLGECLPLTASYLENGTLAVITDTGVQLIGSDGEIRSSFSISPAMLTSMHVSASRIVLACREDTLGTTHRVYVLDAEGNLIAQQSISDKVTRVFASDTPYVAYVCAQNSIKAFDSDGQLTELSSFTGNLLSVCEIGTETVLCFSTGARTAVSSVDQ